MSTLSPVEDKTFQAKKSNVQPIVAMNDVTIYQSEKIVLQPFNLTIHEGEFVYIIGKTGSGKSSLLRTLYADIPLKNGSASVCGYNLINLKRNKIPYLRRKLGIIFQHFNLLEDRNVGHNLDFVLKATGNKSRKKRGIRIDEVLDAVGLLDKKFAMPHTLSGGEQQRVVIARSLLNYPKMIIADEPTGNLDPDTSDDILYLLQNIVQHQNTAVLLATHDYRLMDKFPGRVLKCINGRMEELVS